MIDTKQIYKFEDIEKGYLNFQDAYSAAIDETVTIREYAIIDGVRAIHVFTWKKGKHGYNRDLPNVMESHTIYKNRW